MRMQCQLLFIIIIQHCDIQRTNTKPEMGMLHALMVAIQPTIGEYRHDPEKGFFDERVFGKKESLSAHFIFFGGWCKGHADSDVWCHFSAVIIFAQFATWTLCKWNILISFNFQKKCECCDRWSVGWWLHIAYYRNWNSLILLSSFFMLFTL